MTTSPIDSTVGSTILGRYRVVRKLARGGMGAVYLARTEGAEGFARPVVIKRVLATLMGDDEVAAMFVREARILSELQHPNITPVLDFGQDSDGAYVMVLDYVNGYHLGQWSRYRRKSSGEIPCDIVLYIMGRVLDALHYAHTLTRSDGKTVQIIHRDVTPSNVLLDLQGQVKLLDFGIARVSGDETVMVTETPQVKGKLPYLALEIFQGKDPSARSDVYSAGVVLYELLAGHNPFMGRETADIFHKVLTENLSSVHAVRDDAPEDIDVVLAKAVNRDPAARYQSAAEFAEALSNMQERSDVAVADDLRKQVQQDFQGEMPKALKLEPLSVRDAAWRGTIEPRVSDFARRSSSDPGGLETAGLPLEEMEVATVQAEVPAELLGQSVDAADGPDARATVPPPGRERRSRTSVDTGSPLKVPPPPPLGNAELDPAVFDRVTAPPDPAAAGLADQDLVETAPPPPSPMPEPVVAAQPAAAEREPKARAGWQIPLALVALAISGASLWFSLKSNEAGGEKEIVVIERRSASAVGEASSAPKPPAPAPAPPEPVAPPVAEREPEPTEPAEPQAEGGKEEKADTRPPKPPSPRALSRRFGRKQGRIEACFTKHAKGLEGRPKMAVHFVITEAGKVKEAKLDPPAMAPTPLGKCVIDVAKGTYFGKQQHEFAFRIPITARVVAGSD